MSGGDIAGGAGREAGRWLLGSLLIGLLFWVLTCAGGWWLRGCFS